MAKGKRTDSGKEWRHSNKKHKNAQLQRSLNEEMSEEEYVRRPQVIVPDNNQTTPTAHVPPRVIPGRDAMLINVDPAVRTWANIAREAAVPTELRVDGRHEEAPRVEQNEHEVFTAAPQDHEDQAPLETDDSSSDESESSNNPDGFWRHKASQPFPERISFEDLARQARERKEANKELEAEEAKKQKEQRIEDAINDHTWMEFLTRDEEDYEVVQLDESEHSEEEGDDVFEIDSDVENYVDPEERATAFVDGVGAAGTQQVVVHDIQATGAPAVNDTLAQQQVLNFGDHTEFPPLSGCMGHGSSH